MRLLRELLERQRLEAVGGQLAVDPARVLDADRVRRGLAAAEAARPDRHRGRPQPVAEHRARGFTRAVREVVRGVRRARRRRIARRPARIRAQAILVGLRHQVRIAARLDRQVRPFGQRDAHVGRRAAEPLRDRDGLRRRHPRADLGGRVMQRHLAVLVEFDLRERCLGARAEILLHAREADAVALAGVRGLEFGLARRATRPQRMLLRAFQHVLHAQRAGGNRALRVLHPRAQRVAQAEIDRVEVQLRGDFVDGHLGRGHALQRAVAAGRAGVDRARCDRDRREVALREVVDRLRGRRADHRDRRREVRAPAAIRLEVALERLQEARVAIDRDPVMHLERVTLQRRLELLVAIVREPHRAAVRVQRADEAVERHVAVILRAVADRVARMHEQLLHREAAFRDHRGRVLRHFERRLGRHDEVHRLRRGVVPAVRVVGFERGGIDRLRVVLAVEHEPVRRRAIEFGGDLAGQEHPLLVELAVFLAVRPDRQMLAHHAREDRRVLQARVDIVVVGRLAAHPHVAERAPRIALERARDRTVADHVVAELERVLREAKAREVVVDEDRDRMAEIRGRLAGRQQHVVAVERRERDAVAREIVGGDDAVRLQFAAEQRQVEAFVETVGLRDAQDQRVRLLLRPVRHVGRAHVAGEHFRARDLRDAVDAELGDAGDAIPFDRGEEFFFEERRERAAADGRDVDRDARQHAGFQKTPP
ncbi:hypothetical protein BamIOP4010DRAFT_5269 [Burkholderia ambifaria IOP40-10]|uniref:Uncharacterized protein n=1 Tax=Burkholderia ambifaria IOP40-10 TaxID=396596 RepID=B1FMK8_9BURK|nr:hypothetical protein BamIOP4010DRAFT_5269 [Burkholderia ambifaria IOP40-10]